MSPSLHSLVVPLSEVPFQNAHMFGSVGKPIVLIVDDEKVIADTLAIILSKSGFATFTAYNGIEAVEVASIVNPQLLISDVMMPGMTGVELAIAIGKIIPECKVLLFSGQAATADLLVEARQQGHDFTTLSKPVHPTDMLRRVSESLSIPCAV